MDDLHGFAAGSLKRSTPDLMSPNDFNEAPLQHRRIQRALTVDRDGFVVERNFTRQLFM